MGVIGRYCRLAHFCLQQIRNFLLGSAEVEGMGGAGQTSRAGGHREGREESSKAPLPEGNGTISASRRNTGKDKHGRVCWVWTLNVPTRIWGRGEGGECPELPRSGIENYSRGSDIYAIFPVLNLSRAHRIMKARSDRGSSIRALLSCSYCLLGPIMQVTYQHICKHVYT